MPHHNIDLSSSFTAHLMPRSDESGAATADDALLPLIQHWTLALMQRQIGRAHV